MDATRTPEKAEADFVELLNKQLYRKENDFSYIKTLLNLLHLDTEDLMKYLQYLIMMEHSPAIIEYIVQKLKPNAILRVLPIFKF